MKVVITGREKFGPTSNRGGISWEEFGAWSGLSQVAELVSLDGYYNPPVKGMQDRSLDPVVFFTDWSESVPGLLEVDYLCDDRLNLLVTVFDPREELKDKGPAEVEFLGYDVFNQSLGHSVLVHLGWLVAEQGVTVNSFGLLPDLASATLAVNAFKVHFPGMETAEGSIVGIWRRVRAASNLIEAAQTETETATL